MDKISDNPELQSLLNNAVSIEILKEYFDLIPLGLNYDLTELIQKSKELVDIADKFNNIFSNLGWIATEDFSVTIMKKAVQIFQSSGAKKAEQYLCDCFDDDYFKLHSPRMKALFVWNSQRSRLFDLAYEDHKNGRYHASIPVVLSLIDGLAYDTCKQSFFQRNNASLEIKNGIASHKTGLKSLSRKSSKPITKTRDNPLVFPYRHGILHGREIAYDNRLVSTKCFFMLFAMRPWALQCQHYEFDIQTGKVQEKAENFIPGDLLKNTIKTMLNEK